MADKSHLAIPILDHLDHVALVVLVTSDLGLFGELVLVLTS